MRATNVLILLISIAFLAVQSPSEYATLGFSTTGLLQGRFWTLLTSIFVHVDLFHLAVNMFFLYIFGNALEAKIGGLRTMIMFFAGGVLSLIAGIPFYSPDTHIVGASIAVSALVGGALAILELDKPSSPLVLYAPLGLVALVYVIFNAFMLMIDEAGGVAWPSHIIGFFIGLAFGLVFRGQELRNKPNLEPQTQTSFHARGAQAEGTSPCGRAISIPPRDHGAVEWAG